MNTQKIKKSSVIVISVLMFAGSHLYAQQGRNHERQCQGQGQRMEQKQSCQIPDLTEDQESKINELRLVQMKETTSFRSQMNELSAKKQTLMTSGNSDLKEINAVIDQMTQLQNSMMKLKAKHHQEVRSLLTDDQKVIFDSKPMRGHGHNRGMRDGSRNGKGVGQMHGKTNE